MEIRLQRYAYDVGLYYQYVDEPIDLATINVDEILIIGTSRDIDTTIAGLSKRCVVRNLERVS